MTSVLGSLKTLTWGIVRGSQEWFESLMWSMVLIYAHPCPAPSMFCPHNNRFHKGKPVSWSHHFHRYVWRGQRRGFPISLLSDSGIRSCWKPGRPHLYGPSASKWRPFCLVAYSLSPRIKAAAMCYFCHRYLLFII